MGRKITVDISLIIGMLYSVEDGIHSSDLFELFPNDFGEQDIQDWVDTQPHWNEEDKEDGKAILREYI